MNAHLHPETDPGERAVAALGWSVACSLDDDLYQARIVNPLITYPLYRTGRSRAQAVDRAYKAMVALEEIRTGRAFRDPLKEVAG